MDKKTKEVLDLLYADKIDINGAAKALNMPVEDVTELADEYVYVPTSEEVIKACEIEQETIDYIKLAARQKIRTKATSQVEQQVTVIKNATMDEILEMSQVMPRIELSRIFPGISEDGTNKGDFIVRIPHILEA